MNLSNINKTISENMRFVRDYKPSETASDNAGTAGNATTQASSAAEPDYTQMLNPMIMMMMFQVMMKMMTQMGTGLPQNYGGNYYAPIGDFGNYGNAALYNNNALNNAALVQNPATQYLNEVFGAKGVNADQNANNECAEANECAGDDAKAAASNKTWGKEETDALRAKVADGCFTYAQVGQALMSQLSKADAANLPSVCSLIATLKESGDLNIASFLQNDYLSQLAPERQSALLDAVKLSGLKMADGQPNTRFIAFLLENLAATNPNRSNQPNTQAFLQQFMQDSYGAYGQGSGSTSDMLAQLIALGGLTTDENGQIVFAS